MMHFFLSSSVSCSFGIVVESLNLVGRNSDILSISRRKLSVTFSPVWRQRRKPFPSCYFLCTCLYDTPYIYMCQIWSLAIHQIVYFTILQIWSIHCLPDLVYSTIHQIWSIFLYICQIWSIPLSTRSGLYSYISARSGLFHYISARSGLFHYISARSGLFHCQPMSTSIFANLTLTFMIFLK